MITVSGTGRTSSEIPIGIAAAHDYFADVAAFLHKIDAIEKVKELSRPGAFLAQHHAVGALNYKVVVANCMQSGWEGHVMRLSPLDFDEDKLASEYPVVKGFIEGELTLADHGPASTAVQFVFTCNIALPIKGALKLLPLPLIQTTADGILTYEVGRVVQNLFRKVVDDFKLPAG